MTDLKWLDEILELVFWHGQGNQYPEQNRQPGTSVAEAKQAIATKVEQLVVEAYKKGYVDASTGTYNTNTEKQK